MPALSARCFRSCVQAIRHADQRLTFAQPLLWAMFSLMTAITADRSRRQLRNRGRSARSRSGTLTSMQALKVRVKNGRLVMDEPTDLPDGAEVEVVVIDDKLTPEERAESH